MQEILSEKNEAVAVDGDTCTKVKILLCCGSAGSNPKAINSEVFSCQLTQGPVPECKGLEHNSRPSIRRGGVIDLTRSTLESLSWY
jgi:hypothetical protein